MTSQTAHPVFVTDPEEVRFSEPSEKAPRYTDMPEGVYRLLIDKAETHIILQAKTARKIASSRDDNCWKIIEPRFPSGFNEIINNGSFLTKSAYLGHAVHISEETGWETIASWGDWESIPLLMLAKASIAEDQTKLLSDYEIEQKRLERRSKMHTAITGSTLREQQQTT